MKTISSIDSKPKSCRTIRRHQNNRRGIAINFIQALGELKSRGRGYAWGVLWLHWRSRCSSQHLGIEGGVGLLTFRVQIVRSMFPRVPVATHLDARADRTEFPLRGPGLRSLFNRVRNARADDDVARGRPLMLREGSR